MRSVFTRIMEGLLLQVRQERQHFTDHGKKRASELRRVSEIIKQQVFFLNDYNSKLN